MKQVVVCNERIKELLPEDAFVKTIEIEGIPVTTALIETDDIIFDAAIPENRLKVLVKKRAFSCNYRDKALLLQSAILCNKYNDEKVFFNSVGSDFVADVIAIGPGVKDLKPGDRVITDGHYPSATADFPEGEEYTGGYAVGLPTNNASRGMDIFHYKKLLKIPDAMRDEVAAAFTIGGITSYSMVRKLAINNNERVLVTAAKSNTSLYAINALKKIKQEKGIRLYGLSTSSQHEEKLKKMGVDELLFVDLKSPLLFTEKSLEIIRGNRIQFDCVIDPFWDLYLTKIVNYMSIGARYTSCGLYKQYDHLTGKQHEFQNAGIDISQAITKIMSGNMSYLGNCLGLTTDLQQAVTDNCEGKYDVVIDSVFNKENEVAHFFERTYNANDRWGKVIFKYE